MVQELKDLGICGNCVHRSGCIYLKNSMKEGRPILQCEEFDGSGPRTEGEDLPSLDCFATAPCFGVKSLIPGLESEKQR